MFLIREALDAAKLNADMEFIYDGEKAIRFFRDADENPALPCPDVVLIDINLPRHSGGEVLEHMRHSQRCSRARVLVVTSSDSTRDRDQMAELGASGYFRKPSSYAEFMKLGEVVRALLGDAPAL